MPETEFAEAIRESGLVSEGDRGVVLVSGGADSVALLHGLVEVLGPDSLLVLHVNYGLRPEADQDEALVARVCEDLGVAIEISRAAAPEGNIQAWAREIRLDEAERLREERGLDWIANGHNRSDQAETFLYRLVSSPGVRSLLAMPPRSGRIVRPLLALDRDQIRTGLKQSGLAYAEDSSNEDSSYARNRIRLEVMPELEQVNPMAEQNVLRTRTEIEQDDEALSRMAAEALRGEWSGPGDSIESNLLTGKDQAVVRRMIRQIAEAELERPVAINPDLVREVLRLGQEPEGGRLDLGGGASVLIEAGRLAVLAGDPEVSLPEPRPLDAVNGSTSFGEWSIESSHTTEEGARQAFGNPWSAFMDTEDAKLTLRVWRQGDRIEPLGMSGSKKLQDVFTDGLVPASRRASWPVLVSGETVVWVPGLVRSKHFLIGGPDKPVLRLQAAPPFPI